jgi:hypothetical protein
LCLVRVVTRLAITEAAVAAGDAILGHLDSVRSDIATWEKLARDTQLPG